MNGLKYLHESGVAHRDIKPDNLIISKDKKTLKIADFNVSKKFTEKVMMTKTGVDEW